MSRSRTKVGNFVHSTWIAMNIRCINGKYHLKHGQTSKNKAYACVRIEMTREEYKTWCWANQDAIEQIERPSIDRKDKLLGYSLANIQVLSLAENIRKDGSVFRNGIGRCHVCRAEKPETEFVTDRRRGNGRGTSCVLCERERGRNRKQSARRLRPVRVPVSVPAVPGSPSSIDDLR